MSMENTMFGQPVIDWVHDFTKNPAPGIRAGFTRREGGVSLGQYSSLNLGFHVADTVANVSRNRSILQRKIGAPIIWMEQTHGTHIARVEDGQVAAHGYLNVGKADAIFGMRPHTHRVAIAVMVADCVPLIIWDSTGNYGAVVHVGRAGLIGEIASKVIDRFVQCHIAPASLRVIIGPAICGKCYEIPEDVLTPLVQRWPSARSVTRWGSSGLNIPGALKEQLRLAGITEIHDVGICTYESPQHYSHRRATHRGETTGRFAGILEFSSCPQNEDTPA